MVATKAPAIGMAVRRTISKGEMPAQPATATMTPVIGETVRPNDVANCIGRMRRIVETPNSRAKSGTSGAKAKKGALPLPITMEMIVMKSVMTTMMRAPERPSPFVTSMR